MRTSPNCSQSRVEPWISVNARVITPFGASSAVITTSATDSGVALEVAFSPPPRLLKLPLLGKLLPFCSSCKCWSTESLLLIEAAC